MAGTKLQVRDPSTAERRKVTLQVRSGEMVASLGGPGDPSAGGAVLELYNPGTGEIAGLDLPASNWRVRGSGSGTTIYKYAGRTGPCRTATLAVGRLTASCKGSDIGFTLDEATQGNLAGRLTTGTGVPVHYCMVFGGTVQTDAPGDFTAVAAPAPASCPIP